MKPIWNDVCVDMAKKLSTMSKDPSTQVGCLLVSPDRRQVRYGYNGFPTQIEDSEELWNNRDKSNGLTKYDLVIHAEMNALMPKYEGWEAYVTHLPCCRCLVHLIQAGIKRIFYESDQMTMNPGETFAVAKLAKIEIIKKG